MKPIANRKPSSLTLLFGGSEVRIPAPAMDNNFTVDTIAPSTLRVSGEIDFYSEKFLEEALTHVRGPVTLDFTDVSFMDSTGVKLIVRRLGESRVTLLCPSAAVMKVLEICGVARLANLTILPQGPSSAHLTDRNDLDGK